MRMWHEVIMGYDTDEEEQSDVLTEESSDDALYERLHDDSG